MDEIKHKVLGFLQKQQVANAKIPSMGFSDDIYSQEPNRVVRNLNESNVLLSVNSKTVPNELRPDDQNILDSIHQVFFTQDDKFDASKYILEKLPKDSTLDCTKLADDMKLLKVQQQCVSKRVLNMILQQQTACTGQFQEIIELEKYLAELVDNCRLSRKHLQLAKAQFVSSLGVLANYRKRQILRGLMHYLTTIKTLHETEERSQDLLREGNYQTVITVIKECLTLSSMYRHLTCVAALSKKFNDTLELGEEQLDNALSQICFNFDPDVYFRLQNAYRNLGKAQTAIDQLNMHFTSAVHNTTFRVVETYALPQTENSAESISTAPNRQFIALCLKIPQDKIIKCLVDLCDNLWIIIWSYYQITQWHKKADSSDEVQTPADPLAEVSLRALATCETPLNQTGASDFEQNLNKQYIEQKLINGIGKIWTDVQAKVSAYLLNVDLTHFQFEQFVQILSISHRLIEIGEQFCESSCDELQEAIRKQSVNYLYLYHSSRLEELRIFFENEMWEICPVKANFNILQLQEYKSLRQHFKQLKDSKILSISKLDMSSNTSQDGSTIYTNYFLKFNATNSPFQVKFDETLIDENIMDDMLGEPNSESDSEDDEVRRDFVDESHKSEIVSSTPQKKRIEPTRNEQKILLTNTTLSVLRQIGKYLQMSKLLQPISLDIFQCLTQLFEYYLYSVNCCFTSDLALNGAGIYSLKLNSVLKRISDNLLVTNSEDSDKPSESLLLSNLRVTRPNLNGAVLLHSSENLFGLARRIVAVESVIFLAQQFEFLQSFLEYLIPPENAHIITHFYNQIISVAVNLRKPVYMAVAAQAFDLRNILVSISKVNWEIKDVMSEHNSYIDVLLRDVQVFAMRLGTIESKLQISEEIRLSIWECLAHVISHTLVEGFSNVKKCTAGGRGLMQLDFTQLMSKFEKITNIKSMPHREYVEVYVKAFYYPENLLETFIKDHTEYSAKHMYGLVTCLPHLNKKSRQKFFTLIEEIERNR